MARVGAATAIRLIRDLWVPLAATSGFPVFVGIDTTDAGVDVACFVAIPSGRQGGGQGVRTQHSRDLSTHTWVHEVHCGALAQSGIDPRRNTGASHALDLAERVDDVCEKLRAAIDSNPTLTGLVAMTRFGLPDRDSEQLLDIDRDENGVIVMLDFDVTITSRA